MIGIVVFWLVHIMPEKIAHQRHHPQFEAIRTLCLLSLVFGGLLWPLAWLWAYTKPVGYKMAYGTDKHPDYYKEHGLPDPHDDDGRRPPNRDGAGGVMEIILLGIYCFFVWLIFIKFKRLPWTTPWKVTVAIIPVVALTTLILLLNVFAPVTVRRARHQVRRARRGAGAGTRHRGAGREQPPGQEGRRAVPHRPDAVRQ